MTKKTLIWTIAIIGLLLLLAVPKLLPKKQGNAPVAGGKPGGPPPPMKVTVYVTERHAVTSGIEAVGNMMAEDEVELKSEAQGRVVRINFEEGQEVRKGQLLVKINDADLQAALRKAVSAMRLREENEKRNRQLVDKGGISREAYDASLTELQTASADIDLLREQIRKTEVTAPFDGLIGLRSISEGGFISNANTIARLQNIRRIKIEFSIPEKYASMVHRNQPITFTTEGRPGTFHATIYAIEPRIDPVNRNVVIRAITDNPDRRLLPGGFARVNVALATNQDAIAVPSQSVVPILKGQKVYVVKNGIATEQKVETGYRSDISVEITKGLAEGDSVIVRGVIQVKPGAPVKISGIEHLAKEDSTSAKEQ